MVLKVCVHEWLSGGVSPCQGEGRGFESRLVLSIIDKKRGIQMDTSFLMFEPRRASNGSHVYAPLRSSQGERPLDVLRRLVLSIVRKKRHPSDVSFFVENAGRAGVE